jgi:predicted nucleic acid-binding protein
MSVCLRNGINKVGIPDLIIAQNAKQHGVALFTCDRHFLLIAKHGGLNLFGRAAV